MTGRRMGIKIIRRLEAMVDSPTITPCVAALIRVKLSKASLEMHELDTFDSQGHLEIAAKAVCKVLDMIGVVE